MKNFKQAFRMKLAIFLKMSPKDWKVLQATLFCTLNDVQIIVVC